MSDVRNLEGAACYVYYRVNAADLERVRTTLAKLLAEVRAQTGVEGTLSQRIGPEAVTNGLTEVTLMETYAGIADRAAFEAQLQGAVRGCGAAKLLASGTRRSIEWFVPFPAAEQAAGSGRR